jgi:hypothetical protein
MELKRTKGRMLGFVQSRRKKDSLFIKVTIDKQLHEDYVVLNVKDYQYLRVHVYFFDSLMTTVREFRTIKSCEFFPTAKYILRPSLMSEEDKKQGYRHPDQDKYLSGMRAFVDRNQAKFNSS